MLNSLAILRELYSKGPWQVRMPSSSPSYEETEGIVVLEALAGHQHVVLRDIPVYHGWVDQESAELCHSVDEFVDSLEKVLSGQVDKRDAGDRVAQSRSIDLVADQLVKAYQQVLEM